MSLARQRIPLSELFLQQTSVKRCTDKPGADVALPGARAAAGHLRSVLMPQSFCDALDRDRNISSELTLRR